jgi:nicotinate-nucleotide pyrophosphorylase (carboxylating)
MLSMDNSRLLLDHTVLRLVQIALAEDIGVGDITTDALVAEETLANARFIAKSPGVVAGTEIASLALTEVDPVLGCEWEVEEGALVSPGTVIGQVRGPAASILTGERTALNFLQRMSGVATITRRFVDEIAGTGATMLDTRKTIPGWRILDKYAVTVGGGSNHRMGLWDMVMIKDNHIAAHGSITGAVEAVRQYLSSRSGAPVPIEVETTTLDQVREALSVEGVTRIMFDNASLEMMREGVALVDGRCETEASGNVSLQTVRAIAETGVQFISCGALTHSVPALDISLDVQPV